MKKVSIPNTDLMVSGICYGAAYCGFEDEEKYFGCLDFFVEKGGNFIDTANVYGKWLAHKKNSNEMMLGKWMQNRKNRDKIVLASKAAHPDLSAMNIPRMSREEINSDLEESLSALQTDCLDIFWLHRDAENIPVGEIMETLLEIRKSGKARYFGCSNWKPQRIEQALAYAAKKGAKGFIANQPQWSLAIPNKSDSGDKTMCRMDGEGILLHKRTGLAAIPYSSQAGGYFSKYDTGAISENLLARYKNDENMRVYKNMKKLSEKTGYSCTQISLAYLMSHGFVAIPIIGSKNPEQIGDSVSAADIRLGGDEMELLIGDLELF
ncbi:MAG: aldo/keto reductase [Oscillospiraceae bacterium]|nr:aldo/keto reductase [Oscillospiraceae bacterium]